MIKRLIYVALTAGAMLFAQLGGPKTFGKPEDARDALIQAAASGLDAVKALFGPLSSTIVRTGDDVQDQKLLADFNRRAAEKAVLEPDPVNPDRMTMVVGEEEFPMAVPLVRKNGRWFFDPVEGKAEIRRRTIGANELDAIEICQGYVEAQQMYAEKDWMGKGVKQYARRIRSTEGLKDGLYWPGEDSPVAAGFAKAAAEGYTAAGATPSAYHGYFYKILFSQGPDAAGGERDYIAHDLMIGGFALVAWPAEYGVSGIMTFIVNEDGVVYEKDLGTQTAAVAKAMTKYNPDKSWRVQD